jgi:hypothetical protein
MNLDVLAKLLQATENDDGFLVCKKGKFSFHKGSLFSGTALCGKRIPLVREHRVQELSNNHIDVYIVESPVEFVETEFITLSGRYATVDKRQGSPYTEMAVWISCDKEFVDTLTGSIDDSCSMIEQTKWAVKNSMADECVVCDVSSSIAVGGYNKTVKLTGGQLYVVVYSTGTPNLTLGFDAAFTEES